MSQIQFLLKRFEEAAAQQALVFQGRTTSFGELRDDVERQRQQIVSDGVQPGDAVILLGDYSPRSVALLLALIDRACIVVPLTPAVHASLQGTLSTVHAQWQVDATGDKPSVAALVPTTPLPALYEIVRSRQAPGLVLFTSGSSGRPKAVVHDFSKLLEKFRTRRPAMITLNFLLFDHWGGLNTLLHALSNLCLIVLPERRTPQHVCELIESWKIELLPATPSFLNMLLLSGAVANHDLTSLKVISYGAEPMPESTLAGVRRTFPGVDLRQTYGMIELGVLRAKSRGQDSLWVKVGGEGYDLRVVDGILQIKAESAMLGYINAPSPFTDDGYMITGDLVEQDGEWLRILGRQSDLINVGGSKVYPSEVEAVLLASPLVKDAVVYGEANPITGKIVCADIVKAGTQDDASARKALTRHCKDRLQAYMVPIKFRFVPGPLTTARLKRARTQQSGTPTTN